MHLFAYGTLMDPEIMRKVAGGSYASLQAVLHGFRRYAVRDQPYPGMVAWDGGQVEGVVYLDLSLGSVERLDMFEGEMYSRERVVVRRRDDNSPLEVFAYMVKPQYEYLLTPEGWDYP